MNSTLVTYTRLSPKHGGKRLSKIDRISPHCVVGQWTVEQIGREFSESARQASCNYGIGKDGRIVLIVDEDNRSFCTSNRFNDDRAITIDCASDTKHPYAFPEKTFESLVDLCEDICKRHGKTKLVWIPNKDRALTYNVRSNEMLLTVHRWFAQKACPGDWLINRMDLLANTVTERLNDMTEAEVNKLIDKRLESYFNTKESASDWAVDEINDAVARGITDGSRPRAIARREEVMLMMIRDLGGK